MAEEETKEVENKPADEEAVEEEDSSPDSIEYKEYAPDADEDEYEPGDIVYFPEVRNWLDKGKLVEAYGKVVDLEEYDDGTPYLKVSFAEAKELNDVSLGNEIRKFILKQ